MPAWEYPYWVELYKRLPWDFDGLDYLHSKSSYQQFQSEGKLKDGASLSKFMRQDAFDAGCLDDKEFFNLSDDERRVYIGYAQLSHSQFEMLNDELKKIYGDRVVSSAKNMLGGVSG